jgi:hypothetical protein
VELTHQSHLHCSEQSSQPHQSPHPQPSDPHKQQTRVKTKKRNGKPDLRNENEYDEIEKTVPRNLMESKKT